jgi:hypothetical protein
LVYFSPFWYFETKENLATLVPMSTRHRKSLVHVETFRCFNRTKLLYI